MNGSGARKSVVITGASTGIGEACALRLDAAGFTVFAGVRKDADGARLREQASPRLVPLRIDVTDETTIAAARGIVENEVGANGISGLVNNAGVAVAGPLEFLPVEELRQQLEVNVIGQVAVTRAFMPALRRGHGRIVNMGSIGGKMATAFLGPYSASKFAMEALTDALRGELRPWGMHVAIVEPGSIATPIWDKANQMGDRLERTLPAEGHLLYGEAIRALRAFAEEAARRGIPADQVAKAVEHALTAKRPKTRYIVGRDARIQAMVAAIVPDRLRDRLVAAQIKLPTKPPGDEGAVVDERAPEMAVRD